MKNLILITLTSVLLVACSQKSDPCDDSNWDIDKKNHSPINGWFSSREELQEWRKECLFKN